MTAKRKAERIEFTYELLHRLYVEENLTPTQIAARVGYGKSWVNTQLLLHGIPRKHNQSRDFPLTDEDLRRLYLEERLSIKAIADQIGWEALSVHSRLRHLGIQTRTKGGIDRVLPDKDWFIQEYWVKNRALHDIGAELHMSRTGVRRIVQRLGIPPKPTELAVHSKSTVGPQLRYQRNGYSTAAKKARIYTRDGSMCRMPGCGAVDNLHIHHILALRHGGTDDIDNGITLCATCHYRVNRRELDYVDVFRALLGAPTHA